jgi:hypothetical protein
MHRARWRRMFAACATVCLALAISPAAAHLTPNSEVQLDFGQHHVDADIIIPQGEYAYATGNPTGNDGAALQRAQAYLRENILVRTRGGPGWTLTFRSIAFAHIAGPPDLHAIARLTPPPGVSPRRLQIDWSAVIAAVPNHFVLFVVRSDFSSGALNSNRHILGALQGDRRSLEIDRGDPGLWRGFAAATRLGMRHIADGKDHLLFLLTLLLPAPMLAAAGRWQDHRSLRSTLGHLAGIVTAFTIGHSLTLIAAAALGWQLPARPVEIGIALTILVAAIHAWRPLFAGREALVAAGFGLIHGLAFATVVSRFGLDVVEKALSILGFNIGIEIVQLAVVLALLPALLMASIGPRYPAIRRTGAAFAAVAATAWLVERALGQPNRVSALVDLGLAHPLPIAALLTAAIAVDFARSRVAPGN